MPPLPTPPTSPPEPPAQRAQAHRAIPAVPDLRLLAGALAALLTVAIIMVLLVGGTSGETPPATGAAALVPGDALAYVNLSIDSKRPAVKRALTLAGKFPSYPLIRAVVQARLEGLAGSSPSLDFVHDIQPWLGNEAAVALLNTQGTTAGSLIVLDVRDMSKARTFVSQSGALDEGSYRGAPLRRYASGTVLAFISHFLVLGQDASVRAALDVNAGQTPSLASNPAYKSAAAGEPADRVLDAYVSSAGVRRVLAPQGGIIGAIGALLYQPSLSGVTISVSAASGGARLRVHSALDPRLAAGNARATPFAPSLDTVVPAGSLLMLDVSSFDTLAPKVLNAGAAGGLAGRLGPLLTKLGSALRTEGVNVQDIVSLFHKETVVAVTPSAVSSGATAAQPALTIVARTGDESKTSSELAALEPPLEHLFPTPGAGAGQTPVFNDRQVGGITVHQLTLAPGLEFDYAVANGLVILSTRANAAAKVATYAKLLVDDPRFKQTFSSSPDRVTSLLFLDFSQLLSLGEQTGLERSKTYTKLRADLLRIRTVGLESTSGEDDSTSELFLHIP